MNDTNIPVKNSNNESKEMDNKLEEMQQRLDKLPDKIQKILLGNELADYFLELERQNNLNDDQFDAMVGATHDVFIGKLNPSVFLAFLSGKLIDLGIHPVLAKEIALKIESKFISPFKEDLEKIYHRFSAMEKLEKESQPELKKVEIAETEESIAKTPENIETQKEPLGTLNIGIQPLSETSKKEEPKPLDAVVQPPIQESTSTTQQEEKPKRTFLSFFKFKKPTQETQKPTEPMIIGKEEEFKPVLEESSPWRISFEDVKPAKEKVVSEIELKHEEEIKPISTIEKPIFEQREFVEKKQEPDIKLSSEPIAPPPPITEQKIEPSTFQTPQDVNPIPIVEAFLPKEAVSSEMKETTPIPPEEKLESKQEEIQAKQTPSLENQSFVPKDEEPKQEEKVESKNETTADIPAENVIDLRKLKF